MKNPTKTFLFLGLLSFLLLLAGHSLWGRQGLLTGFALALTLNFVIYFYSENRLKEMFRGREIEGADPWGLGLIVANLAFEAKIPPPRLVMTQLQTPTAFSVGRSWDSARIVISEGLVKSLDHEEIESIIAHEIAHIKKLDTLSFGVGSALAGTFMSGAYGMDKLFRLKSSRGKFGFFTSMIAPVAALLIRLTVSPKSEFEADRFAVEKTNKPEVLARSLWKLHSYASTKPVHVPLSTAHLFIVNPLTTKGANRYFHTQPSVEERIRKLIGRYPV